jgi:hypothetical protein
MGCAGRTITPAHRSATVKPAVLRHLLALIPGEGPSELVGELGDLGSQGNGYDIGGVTRRQPHEHHEPTVPLDERGHGARPWS